MKVTIRNPNAKFELVSCVSRKLYSTMRKCSLMTNLRISGCRGETGEGVAVSRWHEASRQSRKVSVGSACYTSVIIVRTGCQWKERWLLFNTFHYRECRFNAQLKHEYYEQTIEQSDIQPHCKMNNMNICIFSYIQLYSSPWTGILRTHNVTSSQMAW